MTDSGIIRRLTTILAADVAGFSRLMEADEERTVRTLTECRTQIDHIITSHQGRIFGSAGDSVLAEFQSPVEAVRCAIKIQKNLAELFFSPDSAQQMKFRIGVNLGDVIEDGENLFGDGVNIAARLESIADSGGVSISRPVFDQVRKQLDLQFEDLGVQAVKNIAEGVHVYKVVMGSAATTESGSDSYPSMDHPEKPSIAVLPFVNMSGDPEQEYFSDGISADLITELSRFKTLFVIARNSSFRFKGENIDIQKAAKLLGVQYLVEGSVRRAGNRVRISAQLVEAGTGSHLWADKFDDELDDLFEVQDRVTRSIVAVLPGRVQENVVDKVSRNPTQNMRAYELMLQGKAYRDLLSVEGNAKARDCCEKAIALDPRYARAYMYLSDSYIVDLWLGVLDPEKSGLALELARKAAQLDGNDVYIQDHLGFGYLSEGMWDEAEAQFEKTLSKIVNEAESMAWCGYGLLLIGQVDKAREIVLESMQLDPLHPPAISWILGQICYFEGRYDEVVQLLVGEAQLNSLSFVFLAGAYAKLGRSEEAGIALASFIEHRTTEFESRNILINDGNHLELIDSYRTMWRNQDNWESIVEGLRLAGMKD